MEDQFLSKKQVCSMVCKSPTTLWRDCKEGRFPAPKQIGRLRIAWNLSAVRLWMQEQPTVGMTTNKAVYGSTTEAQHAAH